MVNANAVVEAVAKTGLHCQVEGYHHAFSDRAKREAELYVDGLCSEMRVLSDREGKVMLRQMGDIAAWQLNSVSPESVRRNWWKEGLVFPAFCTSTFP